MATSTDKIIRRKDPSTSRQRSIENVLLVWVDESIDPTNQGTQHTLEQLRGIVNEVNIFIESNSCVDFLHQVKDEKILVLISGSLAQQLVPRIHQMVQLHAIYIIGWNKDRHEQWTKEWSKVKGVHTQIEPICKALPLDVRRCNQDSIAISFVQRDTHDSIENLDRLDPSFMYTQLFKNVFLDMEHDFGQACLVLANYCQDKYEGNPKQLQTISEFGQKYHPNKAIWWYTREWFIYQMLNRALRLLEADIIVNMGFFIHDLHRQIERIHKQQVSDYHGQVFFLYRGQGLSITDFEKLQKTQGGLMSFNNFLSTSKRQDVSLIFAESSSMKQDTVGILFIMKIDPSITSTPFADISEFSHFDIEEEVLFSMHTVFRIGDIKRINEDSPVFKVQLTLTADDDEELRLLTSQIDEEVSNTTGWGRLGRLLIQVGQVNKAEELYLSLLENTSIQSDLNHYNHMMGIIKNGQGDYPEAVRYYQNALDIAKKIFSENDPDLASSYTQIGQVHNNMGEYSNALSYYEKALDIFKKSLPENHPKLAASYVTIGQVYTNMGEYTKVLSFDEMALDIFKKTLPANHPNLATSYNNIGQVYDDMGEYSNALSFYEKALDIREKTLPANHPHLAISYSNIGQVYTNMGEYSKALSFHQKALDIQEKTLSENHSNLVISYNDIGRIYNAMGEYSKALSFHEKALNIQEKTFSANNPALANSYVSIGQVYTDTGEHSKALFFYEKAYDILKKTLPANHPNLATCYSYLGHAYSHMGENSKALSYFEKALDIQEKTFLANHPHLAVSYSNIGAVYNNMKEHSKALSFHEKALVIQEKTLPENHPLVAISHGSIGQVYNTMGEHLKALSFHEKALHIFKKSLPENHPFLATSYHHIGSVHYHTKNCSKALSFLQQALDIRQCSLPSTHPSIQTTLDWIERVKKML
jgi:tetratricopeptide (TPR) repeat protein